MFYYPFLHTVKPKFKERNMKSFVVVKSGNTVLLNINFEVIQFSVRKKTKAFPTRAVKQNPHGIYIFVCRHPRCLKSLG